MFISSLVIGSCKSVNRSLVPILAQVLAPPDYAMA